MSDDLDTDDTPKVGRGSSKAIRQEEWLQIVALWEQGDTTLQELGEMFNRNAPNLAKKLKEAGVKKGSRKKEFEERVKEKVEKDMKRDIDIVIERANSTKDDHYKWAKEISEEVVKLAKTVATTTEDIAIHGNKIRTLKDALVALEKGQMQRNIALGLDKGDIIDEKKFPEIVISEFSAEEEAEIIREAEAKLNLTTYDDEFEEYDEYSEDMAELENSFAKMKLDAENLEDDDKKLPGDDSNIL